MLWLQLGVSAGCAVAAGAVIGMAFQHRHRVLIGWALVMAVLVAFNLVYDVSHVAAWVK
jgi:hypothetical protein